MTYEIDKIKMRDRLTTAFEAHAVGHIHKHVANVEVYLNNPTGIGEHSDIMEAIECEMRQIAEYEDMLAMLKKYFQGK